MIINMLMEQHVFVFVFTFSCNLLANNKSWTCCNSWFSVNSLLSLSITSRLQNNVVSSAYSKKLKTLLEFGISFM